MTLQEQIASEIAANTNRHYWQLRVSQNQHVPIRQLWNYVVGVIDNFHSANCNEWPPTIVAEHVGLWERFLKRERQQILRRIAQEESGR